MKRIARFLTFALLFAAMLCLTFAVFAEEDPFAGERAVYYYVDFHSGSDSAIGTEPLSPFKTMTQARKEIKKLSADDVDVAYIVIMDDYELKTSIKTPYTHTVPIIYTTRDPETDYAKENGAKWVWGQSLYMLMDGPTKFENITFEFKRAMVFAGRYYDLWFGENLVYNKVNEDGGGSGLYVYGGYRQPENDVDTERDSHLTIESGDYYLVVAGSRDKAEGADDLVFTGTHYLNIKGGTHQIVYGGSHGAHESENTVIEVSGGEIDRLSAAGNDKYKLNGSAALTLSGGKINSVEVNNVMGKADVYLTGAEVGSCAVTYGSTSLSGAAKKTGEKKSLYYDASGYTSSQIESFSATFDYAENSMNVYARAGASGSGASESDPASFADAFAQAAKSGASVLVLGEIGFSDFTEPAHTGTVTVRGADKNAKLTLSGTYTLSGPTRFEAVTLSGGKWDAGNGKFIAATDVSTENKPALAGNLELHGGSYGKIAPAGTVLAENVTADAIVGGTVQTNIEILSGVIGEVRTTESSIKDFALSLTAGSVEKIVFANVTGSLSYAYYGGIVGGYAVEGTNVHGSLTLPDGLTPSVLGEAASLFEISTERVFYVRDGGEGNGTSANAPFGTLVDAYAAIGEANDGTVVICGEVVLTAYFKAPAHTGHITVTSVYGGTDYRKNGARIVFPNNYYVGGPTLFDGLHLTCRADYNGIYAYYNDTVIGTDIVCDYDGGSKTYPALLAGNRVDVADKKVTMTVNGGKWSRLRLGNAAGKAENVDITAVVNGGEIYEYVAMTSSVPSSGKNLLIVNGGKLYGGIYGSTSTAATATYSGDMTVQINGGEVWQCIRPLAFTAVDTLSGSFRVEIYGGDLSHLAAIEGPQGLCPNLTGKIGVASNIDLTKAMSGSADFTPLLRDAGADPFLFEKDGMYYLTYTPTASNAVALRRAANLGDFATSPYTIIYRPETGKDWSTNLWAPEIHHFTDAEAGAGNGGWYLFVGGRPAGESNSAGMRLYVLKCLDGDDLLGRWGHPVTGEVNVPQKLIFLEGDYNENDFAIDASILKKDGKVYLLFTGEHGRETSGKSDYDFYQTICIAALRNPWTVSGKAAVITKPEYDWEKVGTTSHVYPMVVEGPAAVTAADGTLFIVYSGSLYSTTGYCLGQLKYLGGDLLSAASWEKSPEPFFTSAKNITGCGHCSFVTGLDGKTYMAYHAYPAPDTKGSRMIYAEPCTVTSAGVTVGTGHPSPDTVYPAAVNPTPLGDRISGFAAAPEALASKATVVKLTIGVATGYINGEAKPLDAAPIIRNSRTMLPVRFLAEAFGANVGWDGATSTATITAPGVDIRITIGAVEAQINGQSVALDSPAFIENSRTYLPVRVIADALGAAVEWDGATSTATLTK